MLTVGKKVVYPGQGPCLIGAVVEKAINDRPMAFYQLSLLSDGGGELFVPVNKVRVIGIRPLLEKSEIPKLLDRLKEPARPVEDYRQRARYNSRLLASGSAFDLAEVVESLTELSETRALSFNGHKTLDRAKMLLICEIAEVMRVTRGEAEQQVDKALKAREEVKHLYNREQFANARKLNDDPREIVGQEDEKSQRAAARGA